MKKMNGFEFERGVDSVTSLTKPQLKALVDQMIRRNFSAVLSFHLQKATKDIDDANELEGLAVELLEVDSKTQTSPLFVVYYEGEDEPNDDPLTERFLKAIERTVITDVEKSRSTVSGSRTPLSLKPTTTYRQVASSTRPGHVHTVRIVGGVPVECSCEGFFYNQKCKHLRMV